VIEGTLRADGTLELDEKPKLAPGRVRVVMKPVKGAVPAPTDEGLWEFMQRTRRELETSGSRFMDEEQVHAHIDWEPDRLDDMLQQEEEKPQPREPG
jgi:hypothetical protein